MTTETLNQILQDHAKWLAGTGGKRANLQDADLYHADLQGANLQDADLYHADLRSADLQYADLQYADLQGANLQDADLQYADLRSADLQYADLRSADLRDAGLQDANLDGTVLDPANTCDETNSKQWLQRNGLEVDAGGYVLAWRTKNSQFCGNTEYIPGEYVAPVFSTCPHTECHPGLYFASQAWLTDQYGSDCPIVRVRVHISDIHCVGDKARCRKFTVLEDETE